MNNMITHTISDAQLARFNELAHKFNRLELNLLAFDPQYNCVLQSEVGGYSSHVEKIKERLRNVVYDNMTDASAEWISQNHLWCPVRSEDTLIAHLVLDIGPSRQEATERERTYLACLVQDFVTDFSAADKVPQQFEKFSNELSRAYEEIVLLYNLSTNMKVTQSSASYLQMACDQLTQLVQVEGIAIFVERQLDDRKQLALTAGSGLMSIDPLIK